MPTFTDKPNDSKPNSQQDFSDNVLTSDSTDSIVPTSCTGSLDSINSFDGGKNPQNHSSSNIDGQSINTNEMLPANHSDELNVENESDEIKIHRRHQLMHNNDTNKKCDLKSSANRQSDSTDEDSGIENIVRIAKEI